MNLYLDNIASTDDDDDGGSDDREHEGGALVSDTAHDATVAEEIVEQGPVADTSFFSHSLPTSIDDDDDDDNNICKNAGSR